jgi:uncharacterized SAM-binding protein YcdF (DUF218 family)
MPLRSHLWPRRLAIGMGLALLGMYLAAAGEVALFSLSDEDRAEAAVVLGAAAWGREPSPVFLERIRHAVALYREGKVKRLIFTGGRRSRTDWAEAWVGRRTALDWGVSEKDILVETCSRTTRENLERAFSVGKAYGVSSYVLVSDPLHLRRAVVLARALGVEATSSPTPTTRIQSTGAKLEFLAREAYFLVRQRLHWETHPPPRQVDVEVCGQ